MVQKLIQFSWNNYNQTTFSRAVNWLEDNDVGDENEPQ